MRTTSQSETTCVPPVTAGRGFAGDGALVDAGHTLDDLAVRGHDVAGFDQNQIAFA